MLLIAFVSLVFFMISFDVSVLKAVRLCLKRVLQSFYFPEKENFPLTHCAAREIMHVAVFC